MPRSPQALLQFPPLKLERLEAREVPALGLDPTFGTGGVALDILGPAKLASVTAVAAAPAGKTVLVGTTIGDLPYGAGGELAVIRLTEAGAADPLFGGGDGLATIPLYPYPQPTAAAVLPDGKILLAGTASPLQGVAWDGFVVRLNADGTPDASFGTGGQVLLDFGGMDTVDRIAVQSDGRVIVAGSTSASGGTTVPYYGPPAGQFVVERLNANGTADSTFGTAGKVVEAGGAGAWTTAGIAVQKDGKIVLGGHVTSNESTQASNGTTEFEVRRFNANGTTDATFGTAGVASTSYDEFAFAYANGLALLGDGRIVVAGGSSYGQGLLAWFGPGGSVLSQEQFSWDSGNLQYIDQLIAMPQGGVMAVHGTDLEYHAAPGSVTKVVGVHPVAGFLSAGAALAPDGKLVVAGYAAELTPISDPDTFGGPPAAFRLADPGTTESPSTFVLWTSPTTVPGGTTALVASAIPLLGSDTITDGTITFREGATVLGTVEAGAVESSPWIPAPGFPPLPGPGVPAGVTVTLSPGDHTITAEYSGTDRWAKSSATATFHVGRVVPVTAALTVSNPNPAPGEAVVLTAALSKSGLGAWTNAGSVTFYDNDAVIGTASVLLNGIAALPYAPAGGTHSLRAQYSGAEGYSAAAAGPVQVTVGRAASAVVVTSLAPDAVAGGRATLTALVRVPTSPAAIPGGTVTFYDGATALGSAALDASGQAALTTDLRLGNRTFRVSYGGDATTFGSDSPPIRLTIGRAPTTTTLTAPASVAAGQSVALTATVKPTTGSAFPVGTVEFREGTRVLGTATLDGRGQAKLVLTNLSAGEHAITAVYAGCSTCEGSTSAASSVGVAGASATTTVLSTNTPNPVFGQDQTLTAHVDPAAGAVPGGRVEFYDGTTLLGSAALDTRGQASLAVRLNLGAHKLKAVYLGAPPYSGSSSAVLTETVAKAPTTVTLSAGADGRTVRAHVRAAFAGSPIGTITFKEGDTVLGTVSVNGNGAATVTFAFLTPGKHRITAAYGGSSCFLGATSAPLEVTI